MGTNGREGNLQLLDNFLNLGDKDSGLYKEVFGFLLGYMGHYQDCEDVMSEVKEKLLKKRDQYNPDRPLRPWLFTVANRALIDHQRRNWRWTNRITFGYDTSVNPGLDGDEFLDSDPEDSSKGALDKLVDKEDRKKVRTYINRLPCSLRKIIGLVYFQRLKYREAADILQIPVGTVKSRLHSGIAKMRELMYGDVYRDVYRPAA